MKGKVTITMLALLAGAAMFSSQGALAGDFRDGVFAKTPAQSLSSKRTTGWIQLHRVDGEVTHINVDQIVFVTNAKNTGGNERAKSRVQLVNGFSDVLETVGEVMQSIENRDSVGIATGSVFDDIVNVLSIGRKED